MPEYIEEVRILIAEDDEDDKLLLLKALRKMRFKNDLHFVKDGVELFEYLDGCKKEDYPGLILLDLNMPRMDGRESLEKLKKSDTYRHIPTVVMTTSREESDVINTYELGVNSYIVKPVSFHELLDAVQKLTDYWFHIVKLPNK